jgi:BlaI family transcriptional regulator, penicillinase repressor
MGKREYEIGAAEFQVLKVLWDSGPLPVRDVLNRLHKQGKTVAYTTVQTLLTRLEQKGFVKSDKSGLAHVFRSCLSQERVRKSRVRKLVSQLYDGAAAPLVLQLIKTERFTREEIDTLQQLIDELDSSEDT